jgi:hypothetical protein
LIINVNILKKGQHVADPYEAVFSGGRRYGSDEGPDSDPDGKYKSFKGEKVIAKTMTTTHYPSKIINLEALVKLDVSGDCISIAAILNMFSAPMLNSMHVTIQPDVDSRGSLVGLLFAFRN